MSICFDKYVCEFLVYFSSKLFFHIIHKGKTHDIRSSISVQTSSSTEDEDGEVSSQEMIEDALTRRALGSKSLQCDHCELKTRSATFLKRHIKTKHQDIIKCDQCEYNTGSKADFERHINLEHVEKEVPQSGTINIRERITCEECNFKSTSECVMKRHIELKHKKHSNNTGTATNSKRRTCNICGKKFNKENTFKTHMEKIHAGTSNNLNLNKDYASNNEEVQRRATPLKRGSAKSVATSEQDLQ